MDVLACNNLCSVLWNWVSRWIKDTGDGSSHLDVATTLITLRFISFQPFLGVVDHLNVSFDQFDVVEFVDDAECFGFCFKSSLWILRCRALVWLPNPLAVKVIDHQHQKSTVNNTLDEDDE